MEQCIQCLNEGTYTRVVITYRSARRHKAGYTTEELSICSKCESSLDWNVINKNDSESVLWC